VGAGFLRHKAAVLRDVIKDTHCSTSLKRNTIIVRILLSSVFPVASCLFTTVQETKLRTLIHICRPKRHKHSYRTAYESYIATKSTPTRWIPFYSSLTQYTSLQRSLLILLIFWKLISNQNEIVIFLFTITLYVTHTRYAAVVTGHD
jgi:hypothetical protein